MPSTEQSTDQAIEYALVVARADQFRAAGLLHSAAAMFLNAAHLAPDSATETALVSRAFECTERAHWWQRG